MRVGEGRQHGVSVVCHLVVRGVGPREEVAWEVEAEVQGQEKGTPRGSCGSVGGCE